MKPVMVSRRATSIAPSALNSNRTIADLLGSGATGITGIDLSGFGRDANEHAVPLDSVSIAGRFVPKAFGGITRYRRRPATPGVRGTPDFARAPSV